MAREEVDREDLLRDARALVRRIELTPRRDNDAPVVIGFRENGAASFYFGTNPSFHFNTLGELRRAYVDDRLLKAERGRLVSLRRLRTAGEVQLLRTELDDEQIAGFLQTVQLRLNGLRDGIASQSCRLVGQVPQDGDVLVDVRAWLDEQQDVPLVIAQSPHAR